MAANSKLFSEFGPTTKKEWIEQAIADLKGADFEKKLVWSTDEGFPVQPFYTAEDLEKMDPSAFRIDSSERKWDNLVSLDVNDIDKANKLAKKLSEFDVNGIQFNITDASIDFKKLLLGIDLSQHKIAFKLPVPSASFVTNYFNFVQESGIKLTDIEGFIEADPIETWTQQGISPDFDALAELVKVTSMAKKFKGLTICSHAFADAGSNVVQEMAFTLNKMADFFDQLSQRGISSHDLANELHFHLAIGGNYFFEIAKLRAFRVLTGEVLSCYGVKHPEVNNLSSSSKWSKSLFDPQVNLLRNTTEAMSAILGGANGILINPHDSGYQQPSEISHRIALNISAILKEESYFDKVADPAAGSYYIEEITKELAEKANQLFQKIEKEGGFINAFKSGVIQGQIAEVRNKKYADYATRKRVMVGTNKYPDQKEKATVDAPEVKVQLPNGIPLLIPHRMTSAFDDMRMRTIKKEKAPKVMLVCFGNLTMRKARAAFSTEFFGTSGFEVMEEYLLKEIDLGAKEIAKSDADIVVLCSSDEEYGTMGVEFALAFRKLEQQKKLIVAGYPADLLDKLHESGVDSFIHMKTNVIEFISGLQKELF